MPGAIPNTTGKAKARGEWASRDSQGPSEAGIPGGGSEREGFQKNESLARLGEMLESFTGLETCSAGVVWSR